MGSAAAWQLARRGRQVLLLERFAPGHHHGASHGATRNFNTAYAQPVYLDLVLEALGSWRELEAASGTVLLDLVGLVNHGVVAPYEA
ncbi:FAD-dependent oxidoreductase, partial [Kineococcus glutinatus]|uniref:FAD-dependent oxidoreductase n=1 Tax=Kineococcus glutinatus TaxID=1070872 RepID=UPI003CD0AC24